MVNRYIFLKKYIFCIIFFDFLKICYNVVVQIKGAYEIMKKLTKQKIKDFKKQSDNALTKCVCDYIINEWDDEHEENNENILLDIINYGCANGAVHWLTYSSEILKFYNEYKSEINEMLSNLLFDCEYKSPADLFGDKWNKHDPLALENNNKQLLAWFGFEETIINIAIKFGIE